MRWIWYCTLLAYIAFLLGLIYTIIIDYDDKNPVKTICWILVVIFLPLLGISAYYIVGRNVSKSSSKFQFWREEFNRHQSNRFYQRGNRANTSRHYKELKSLILNLEQSPVFGGNKSNCLSRVVKVSFTVFSKISTVPNRIFISSIMLLATTISATN